MDATIRVLGQAKRFSKEIAEGVKRPVDLLRQVALDGLRRELDVMAPRVRQVTSDAERPLQNARGAVTRRAEG